MKPKLIKTEKEHRAALRRIEEIFDAKPRTPEGDELDLLVTLVELYEDKTFPIGLPSPVEAIKFRMEQQGLRPKDLARYLGGANRVSEVLAGRRALTVGMIQKLHRELGIPAEVLVNGSEAPAEEEQLSACRSGCTCSRKCGNVDGCAFPRFTFCGKEKVGSTAATVFYFRQQLERNTGASPADSACGSNEGRLGVAGVEDSSVATRGGREAGDHV